MQFRMSKISGVWQQGRRPGLALVLCVVLFCALLPIPALAAKVTIPGGGGSTWFISDDLITDNGLPAGGICSFRADGAGAAVSEAELTGAGQTDAFDFGMMLWVNNTQVGGALAQSGNTVTFVHPTAIAGLNVQLQYEVLTTSATARALLTLHNPTAADISVPIDYAGNFGSDYDTTVGGTSSGDTTFTTADRWLVTHDDSFGDVVNTSVLYGPDTPAVIPSSVSQTASACAGTQGVLARYEVSVPAGQTRHLLFFHQLNDTPANALTNAAQFDTTPALSSDLLVGLSESQLIDILNWDFPAPDLTLSKSHVGDFEQGQSGAQYALAVSNIGTAATSGLVTVIDTLPAGLTATALAGTGWDCTLATLTCTRSDALAAGSSYPDLILTVDVAGDAPSSVTNNAGVSGGNDADSSNNSAADPTTIVAAPPPATPLVLISSNANGSVSGVSFRDEDIIANDPTTHQWSLLFDGSDVGLGNVDVDAFGLLSDGRFLLSVDKDFRLSNFGPVDESDILAFTPTSLGNNTAGSYTLYFDGSAYGLTTSGEDVDAIDFAANGNLVVSVSGEFRAPGVSGEVRGNDEDLLVLSGSVWSLYFDGSDVGLGSSSEDVQALWADHANSKLYFATLDDYSLPGGLRGNEDDIIVCTYTSLGSSTACSFSRFWNGDLDHGFDQDAIDGLVIGPAPVVSAATVAGVVAVDDTIEAVGDDVDEPNELDGEERPDENTQEQQLFLPNIVD